MAVKRKVTITIDEDLASALESVGGLSAQLNEAWWTLLERRRRAERLATLLDQLDRSDGPLPADPEEDARIERLLGGAA